MEKKLREELVAYGIRLLDEGLVQGTWGNLSVKLDDYRMLVTPSGIDYRHLTPDDMVIVDINTLENLSEGVATSEKGLHGGIYKMRPEVGAIIHTHSTNCSVFAAARMPLQIMNEEYKKIAGDIIDVSEYALAGTEEITENVLKSLDGRAGSIIANHGMVGVGADLEEAFKVCQTMEAAAGEYIDERYR